MARRFDRKPLTDEQRDARRKADRDRVEQAARALLSTDGWQRWIKGAPATPPQTTRGRRRAPPAPSA